MNKLRKKRRNHKEKNPAPKNASENTRHNDDKTGEVKLRFKKRMIGTFIGAVFFAIAFLFVLWIAFNDEFRTWQTLLLFALVIADIAFWISSYVFKEKYGESLEKNAKRNYGSGNRTHRRKSLK